MTISSLMKNYLERHTTGLEVEKFKILYEYLDPGENCENIKYHEPAKDKEEDRSDILSSPSFLSPASKPGPRPKLASVDKTWFTTETYSLAL